MINIKVPNRRTLSKDFLSIEIKDVDGVVWGKLVATTGVFSTGSIGFKATGKIEDPYEPGERYQLGLNMVLIGSGPPKKGKEDV